MWNNKYFELKNWIESNNKIPSPSSKDSVEKSFGIWCCRQRKNKKTRILSDKQIKQLNKLNGWYWSDGTIVRIHKTFEETYEELKKWIELNNRIPSHKSKNPIEKSLGEWCSGKRKSNKNGKLIDSQIKQLSGLNGWYWNLDDLWNIKYSELKKWIETNNKLPSFSSKDSIEKILCKWCYRLRESKKNNKLSDYQIKQLNKISKWHWTK